ncbi:CoA transferase [Sphingobium sp. AR-3-1]|uniref:CoA transferase n=1 Tax=Sphingobium psychrophilum TaxID=2728834 RepID=A0A7X9WZ94_9SPHN|nr:CoA transferase [Sphingobium psychrophilum]NML12642.1 CoA transferase [Sphingobium psychrophilum]
MPGLNDLAEDKPAMAGFGPLAGYRILEFGTNLTAPMATMLMGDQGADVIKVEPIAGEQLRSSGDQRSGVAKMGAMFLNANRNKRSIALDLKRADHLDAALRIAGQCDVVVQNFRPGVADRIGIGYDAIAPMRSDIIYVSIDGLGDSGPEAHRRVYDIVVQGIAGIAAVQADSVTGEPTTIRNAIVDKATALVVWQAVTAALLVRERTGMGQHIRVSMLNVALSFIWPEVMSSSTLIGEDVVVGGSMAGVRYCFATADGHILVGFVTDDEFAGVCRVLGCPDLPDDLRFDTVAKRFANAAALNALIGACLLQQPTGYWLPRLREADAVYAPINRPDDLAADPQIMAIGALAEHDHPVAGRYRQPVHPIRFSGTPTRLHRHAPMLDADRDAILAEFGVRLANAP